MNKIKIIAFMMMFTLYSTTTFTGCEDSNATDGVTPSITLEGNTSIEIPLGTMSIPEYGYSAFDFQDGDITDKVQRTHNIDWTKGGDYQITYSVTDSDGNVGTAVRYIRIVNSNSEHLDNGGGNTNGNGNNGGSNNNQDYAPVITFNQYTVYLNVGESFIDSTYFADYKATDTEDGDLTSQVIIDDNNVNINVAGTYIVTYSVTDSAGNRTFKSKTVVIQNSYNYTDTNNNNNNNNNNDNYNDNNSYYSELDNFKTWYRDTCGRIFNDSRYNASTRKYHGTIDCSHQGLTSIDLSNLSLFDGIDDLDLSNNNLSYIDFSPIQDIHEMWGLHIDHNTATLKKQYDTESERNALFRYFTNIHGGDGSTSGNESGLYIYFKPHPSMRIFFDDSE